MREILFRGKRKNNNEWIEGSLHTEKFTDDEEYLCCEVCQCDVYPETLGQYTGLTDKNGAKIFEGDIVDILTENEEIGVVVYDDGGFVVNADTFCLDFHTNIYGTDLEVIGNIHDNPELMKE